MTTIIQQRLPIPAARMNGESTLPLLYDIRIPAEAADSNLDENDGLFLGYGGVCSAFPYKTQDCYGRELHYEGLDGIVLENDHLRAVFVPSLGGKLWSYLIRMRVKNCCLPIMCSVLQALRCAMHGLPVVWSGTVAR